MLDTYSTAIESPSKADRLSAMQIAGIRECHTKNRQTLENMFEKMGFSSLSDKSRTLLKAMGIGKNDYVFYSGYPDDNGAEEDQYEAVVGAFFSGAWK